MRNCFDKYLKTKQGKPFRDKFLQLEPQEEVDCYLCGASEKKIWFSFGSFKAVTCLRCGLRYISPRLSNQDLDKVYKATYIPANDYEGRLHDMSLKKERLRKRQDMQIEIETTLNHKKAGRVLDVGCGAGIYLEALSDNWEKFGIDRAPWAARYTQEALKIPIQYGEVEEANFANDYFDVINMTYVIEHLRNPVETLAILRKWLKKDGVLIVSVPNFGSVCAMIFKEFYRLVDPCQHIYMFSPQTLKKTLDKAGFITKKMHYPYFGTPYCNAKEIWRLFVNAFRRNLLPFYLKINAVPAIDKLVSPPFYGNIMVAQAYK